MKNNSILVPLFRTIDKVLFGIDDLHEIEKQPEFSKSDNEEEFDAEPSSN